MFYFTTDHRHPGASKQQVLQWMLLRVGDSFKRRHQLDQYISELLKFDVPFLFTTETDTSGEDERSIGEFERGLHAFIHNNCQKDYLLSHMSAIVVSEQDLSITPVGVCIWFKC